MLKLELVRAGDVRVGDRVMPEEYDEHVGLDGYDVDAAEEVTLREEFDRYRVTLVTPYERVVLDVDDQVMRVVASSWVGADGRDQSDLP